MVAWVHCGDGVLLQRVQFCIMKSYSFQHVTLSSFRNLRNYMNDSFRTNVFMKYQPETIACACIFLAARQLQVPLPDSPPWYYLFEVEEDEIRDICIALLNLYSRPKPNCDELEKIVEKAKKIQVEAKLKAKGLSSEYGTPNSTSRQNSPKNVSPNPSILPGMRKVKLEEDHHSDGSHGSRNHNSKKRGHSGSDHSRSDRSPSHSRSRSSRTSSSRSTSRSPVSRKKMRSPSRKYKKERRLSPIRYTYKEKHSHKRKRRSRSRSQSRSHEEHYSKSSLKKYYKEKDRGYSPDRHRSRKHRNGHRANSRDRYDKYRR